MCIQKFFFIDFIILTKLKFLEANISFQFYKALEKFLTKITNFCYEQVWLYLLSVINNIYEFQVKEWVIHSLLNHQIYVWVNIILIIKPISFIGADPTLENVNGHKPIDYTKNQTLQTVLSTAETKVGTIWFC